ncbi:efflux RND transporter periplasmic adaptor subunit [Planctomycetes bacterium K23_9]|uniref:Cobalt-zinc-cadmium resistance protein CzcB n=1 Tax=Stieleria marina TaxID=1930275 RepID=A0A517NUR9_9BACT|nr:Cobalt-zinc-cadmium resistance protein CzcB [Planctomycetes bacterium K23_9]
MKPNFRTVGLLASILACVALLGFGVKEFAGKSDVKGTYVFYTVQKTDLPIVVTERGNLESQVETTIACQVENIGDRSSSGTQIIFIVPNGSAVEKDQLLVEFDSATIRDRLDEQTLAFQRATSSKTQAIAKYENQLLQNQTSLAEAKLQKELAVIELEMYKDEQDGTAKLAKEEIDRKVDESKNAANEARATLELAEVERDGMKELFKLGYRGKSDLEQSRLKYLQAEDKLASSLNQIKTFHGNRRKLDRFERLMEEKRLQGAVDTADRSIQQVINDNKSLLEQALAAKNEAINTETKEKERLERMQAQLVNCKIYAPHSGMVVYKRERRGNTEIMEGAMVRERQDILTLPDLSKMKVKTQVHEAALDQIRPGLPASIRVDAFPDRTYRGVVEKVGVVPTSSGGWYGSGGVKTYETEVRLFDEVESLKPGMTAVVDMHVDRIEDILAVPVQSIIQTDGETWCYIEGENGVIRKPVQIGRSNDKFVHVQEGIAPGDLVVLNSMDIYEQQNDQPKGISADSGAPEMSESLAQVGYDTAKGDLTANAAMKQGGGKGSAAPVSSPKRQVNAAARASAK